ncbi:hypothetical protein [Burkholderia stabilis]|uniref:hypothetical protein n=1 Tax=Burkholderia stabilis TaxID=95485 RepID=UPI001F4AD895|nr:hypothetical protein [Burkholderia stabilis]
MQGLLTFVLGNPAFLVVPLLAFAFSLVLLCFKKRFVNDGTLFRREPATERDHGASKSAKSDMTTDHNIDLEIALRKFHELGLADGDLGYAYWHEVGQLLKRAAGMQAQIDALSNELDEWRALKHKNN